MFKKLQPFKQKPTDKIGRDSDLYCPKCGSMLFQNNDECWCSDWDSQGGCGYGIKKSQIIIN